MDSGTENFLEFVATVVVEVGSHGPNKAERNVSHDRSVRKHVLVSIVKVDGFLVKENEHQVSARLDQVDVSGGDGLLALSSNLRQNLTNDLDNGVLNER